MVRAGRGDENAFGLLYDRYAPAMLRFFARMLHPDREKPHDMLQDLFTRLYTSPGRYDPAQPFRTWLYSVAANMGRNEIRNTRNRQRLLYDHYTAEESYVPGSVESDNELFRQEYDRLCAGLDESRQLLLHLRFGEELQVKEIAQIMDLPEGTVKSRLHYLLRRFAAELNEFNPQN